MEAKSEDSLRIAQGEASVAKVQLESLRAQHAEDLADATGVHSATTREIEERVKVECERAIAAMKAEHVEVLSRLKAQLVVTHNEVLAARAEAQDVSAAIAVAVSKTKEEHAAETAAREDANVVALAAKHTDLAALRAAVVGGASEGAVALAKAQEDHTAALVAVEKAKAAELAAKDGEIVAAKKAAEASTAEAAAALGMGYAAIEERDAAKRLLDDHAAFLEEPHETAI